MKFVSGIKYQVSSIKYQVLGIKYFLVLCTLYFILYTLYLIPSAFAHVLKTDGEIGAVVHIDPEDDPIVGEETTIYFDIKDKSGRFRIEDCDCQFFVKIEGTQAFSETLEGTTARYNFPEKNIYTLELVGKSKNNDSFQPFKLSYDLRIERESEKTLNKVENNPDSSQTTKYIVFGVIALIGGIGIYFVSSRKK